MLLFQSLVAGTLGLLRTRLGLGEGFRAFVSTPHFRPGGKERTNPGLKPRAPSMVLLQSEQIWVNQTPCPALNISDSHERPPWLQHSISQGSLHPTHLPLTHTVVADTAVWGPGWPKHLASEAVLQLHHLPVDHHLPSPRGWPVRGTACVVWGWEERKMGDVQAQSQEPQAGESHCCPAGRREASGQISGKRKLG